MRIFIAIITVLMLYQVVAADDKPLAGAIIVIDPGHGGQSYSKSYTGGSRGVNSKLTESELNLRVSLELEKILKAEGATVHMTRVADHRLSREGSSSHDELHARIDFFEHHACHFFISVHHNAAENPSATGHTAIYKHNAEDDKLYEALAREVNDALAAAVPGPRRALIKQSYHLTRETKIPGTITEAGFMTNPAFDKLSNEPGFAQKEATALAAGITTYWRTHKPALEKLRENLIAERAANPRDPKTYTAIELNPEHRESMRALLKQIAPDGKYDPAKVADYMTEFKKLITDPKAKFEMTAEYDGQRIKLTGKVGERKYHDQFIDLLVAMKLFTISNEVVLPK